jgi:Arc/MetJ-type ribon-helix-helix transcriptional regulator
MSKGNRVIKVRVSPELIALIERQIQQRNYHSREAPWVISDWIRVAMIEKLDKMRRSRRSRDRRVHSDQRWGVV